jgi:putative CocE/NonD family hydrolase
MNKKHKIGILLGLALCLVFSLEFFAPKISSAQEEAQVSKLGEYRGYSQPITDEWVRSSFYVTVRDGTKLAVDIVRPAKNGKPVEDSLPVIWTHHRYHRAHVMEDGQLRTAMDSRWLQKVLKHGYIIAAVDVRGGGASYGSRQGPFTQEESEDAYDITEWLASQPWCNGKVGMYGRSYLGITQYMAASKAPPHLKAIFPEMALFDSYSFVYPGGVFHYDFLAAWSKLVKDMDNDRQVASVDEDRDGTMLEQAIKEHQANTYAYDLVSSGPFRDSKDDKHNLIFQLLSPSSYIEDIKKSGIAVYHLAGWYDLYPRDAVLWFNNLNNPQKIVIGPWHHSAGDDDFLAAEHLRWYDYWLKDIDNGIMDEPSIYYYTMGAPEGTEWRSAVKWPLPEENPTSFYFHEGKSESIQSRNDGILSLQIPSDATGKDDYVVDYSTTSGKATRWTNGYGGKFEYPDMRANDEKGITYTTRPLDSDIEVTGHPVIHLWITSTADDADFFAYLEEVDENGYSHYITEGTLRASHRRTSSPPYNTIGLPFHRSYAEDIAPLPTEPAELVFDLLPTSNIFDRGHRIRVTITCADKDTALTPELSPPPTVSIYRNENFASYISLPIIPQVEKEGQRATRMIIILVLIVIIFAIVLLQKFLKPKQIN